MEKAKHAFKLTKNKKGIKNILKLLLPLSLFLVTLFKTAMAGNYGQIRDITLSDSGERVIKSAQLTDGAIQPYEKNPWYWEINGEPILLRGGSDEDNLWQWTGRQLTDHLDLLVSVGGNYLRCTMSDRDQGNVFAYREIREGVYDLDQWNYEYWDRFVFFLDETGKRGIVVQVTLWDWFDLGGARFGIHPLNPANNINLESGVIKGRDDYYGGSLRTNNQIVLDIQKRWVTKLVSITFQYGHVLYNIGNESSLGVEWENYWASFLKERARDYGKDIYVTTMNLAQSTGVRQVMTYPDLYSFVDISQNNQDFCGARGRMHYDNVMFYRSMIELSPQGPMPINNEKIYGGTTYAAGPPREAEERFWRNIFAGAASVRFHRPADGVWGIGLTERAQIQLKALTALLEEFDIFSSSPYPAIEPVGYSNEAYALAKVGDKYAIYFPAGRWGVKIDTWIFAEQLKIKWLNIDRATWSEEEIISIDWTIDPIIRSHGFDNAITLWTPGANSFIALIEVIK